MPQRRTSTRGAADNAATAKRAGAVARIEAHCVVLTKLAAWPAGMHSEKRSAARNPRARYIAPVSSAILETTVEKALAGRRSLSRTGQQELGEPFQLAERTIWYTGDLGRLNDLCVSIVGTRNVSEAGATRARRLARELAEHSIIVVSGLAKGVDTAALEAAMAVDGRVVGVIGTPLQKAYPIENAAIQQAIAARHLLVSPFPAGSRTFPSHFPERDRLMAALTDATVVIEAGDRSGTLHQCAECVRLGRWLFIAHNLTIDPSITWPGRFQRYPRTRTLTHVSDVLTALKAW